MQHGSHLLAEPPRRLWRLQLPRTDDGEDCLDERPLYLSRNVNNGPRRRSLSTVSHCKLETILDKAAVNLSCASEEDGRVFNVETHVPW